MDRAAATQAAMLLIDNVENVIRRKRETIDAAANTRFAGEHLPLEDVPSEGKTMLDRAIDRSVRESFKRIQATTDLLPSDVTGSNVYNQANQRFEFLPRPVFANVDFV